MTRVVVLISGRGSNMLSLLDAAAGGALPVQFGAVISNKPEAPGLVAAAARGIATEVVDHRNFESREAFDRALAAAIDRYSPDLVVLAGFMRILTDAFVTHYAGRLMNIHPSLLPSFPGVHTHRQALDAGVRVHGCTVHFVTPRLDHGPIVVQAAVPVFDEDDEASLSARVLVQEHVVYPLAVRWFAEGRLSVFDGKVRVDRQGDTTAAGLAALISPEAR